MDTADLYVMADYWMELFQLFVDTNLDDNEDLRKDNQFISFVKNFRNNCKKITRFIVELMIESNKAMIFIYFVSNEGD